MNAPAPRLSPLHAALDKIADLLIEAMEHAGGDKHVAVYMHVNIGDDFKAGGYFNTGDAGNILDLLCKNALAAHIADNCAHCDAVAKAIGAAQRTLRAVVAAAEESGIRKGHA